LEAIQVDADVSEGNSALPGDATALNKRRAPL